MENYLDKQLPPIFKFSSLCNILPYYGLLYEWKRLLESICKKTKLMWSKNKQALVNLGSEYLGEIEINYKENLAWVPKNAELFMLTTDWFDYKYYDQDEFNDIDSWRLNNLFLPLLNQLHEKEGIVIDNDIDEDDPSKKSITFITENEESELLPSPLWTSLSSNIKRFNSHEVQNLCKHISDRVVSKIVIIKKLKSEIFEVNSVTPIPVWFSQDYNILNNEKFDEIKDYLSCPVPGCIWKPFMLCWSHYTDSIELNNWSLDDIDNETTEKILRWSFLCNIWQLNILGLLDFDNIFNIIRISNSFSQMKIYFNLGYKFLTPNRAKENLKVQSNDIICIFRGELLIFEAIKDFLSLLPFRFKEFQPVENEKVSILKIDNFMWFGLTLSKKILLDDRKQEIINKLKNDTKQNDDLYVVSDNSSIIMVIKLEEIDEYISFFKYWKHIEIKIGDSETQYKEEIKEIKKLPKQYNYKFKISNLKQFINSDAFDLIVTNFNWKEEIVSDSFKIKIEKIESDQESNIWELKFILINKNNDIKTVNYNELKEIMKND